MGEVKAINWLEQLVCQSSACYSGAKFDETDPVIERECQDTRTVNKPVEKAALNHQLLVLLLVHATLHSAAVLTRIQVLLFFGGLYVVIYFSEYEIQ